MKEDFLHYLWQNQKFDFTQLQTSQGDSIQILNKGIYTQLSGPDFFNAQIIIGTQKWAGNIEIHCKSSDWYLHNHQLDTNYDNTILHVVWEHDAEVFRKDNTEIPVLEMKGYVDFSLIAQYQNLKSQKTWINCENEIKYVESFVLNNWKERLYLERLEKKSVFILEQLKNSNNDWEETFFCSLAKNFGLNINGNSFFQIAKSIPFSVIRKESFDVNYLEALFFGKGNLIPENPEDNYAKNLKALSEYITIKYQLKESISEPIQFYKLRPDNFPTVRLAQLAMLYYKQKNLFSNILEAKSIIDIYNLFDVSVSEYWINHYNFDKPSKEKEKRLSKSFIDLLIINTILPFKFTFHLSLGKENTEDIVSFVEAIPSEKNAILDKFEYFGIVPQNAFDSQSLLQLKNEYCSKNKCLNCPIGLKLLKN
ncbi:MAG: DUF2851 family protein [Limnohabitans sp.]|nr:DUF2851 family protein [Limnohabitans sp.]